MDQSGKEKLEQDLANALTEGEMAGADPDEAALHRLSPRYVARARAERDPIVEETKLVRQVVREIDGRYDDYLSRVRESTEADCDAPETETPSKPKQQRTNE